MAKHTEASQIGAPVIDPEEEVFDTEGAAVFLKLSDRTLEGLRVRGGGPAFLNPSPRIVRYLKSDLIAWLKEYRRISTSNEAGRAR